MKKNNKVLAGTLAALLFFVAVPFGSFAFAEEGRETMDVSGGSAGDAGTREEGGSPSDGVTGENGDIFVDKVTLWDSDGNEVVGEMSTEKQYRLRYDMISPLQIKLDAMDVMAPPYMEKGKEYLLPEITNDFCNFAGKIAVKAIDSSGNIVTVATVKLGTDGIPVFIVEDDLDKGSILDGYFEVLVNINLEKIGEEEDYTFTLPKGESLTAEIVENRKLPPTVSKEAAGYDPDSNTITWRVMVQNAEKPKESLYPLKFSDVIGEGQTYVEGSFQVAVPEGFAPEEFEVFGSQLTWQCSEKTGGVTLQYEYQTVVDVLKLLEKDITNADISVTAKNTLSVAGGDGSELIGNITAVQTITGKPPVSIVKSEGKAVRYNEEDDTGEIEWVVTITNNGYAIRDLTVYDYFEAGKSSVSLKGIPECDPLPAVNGRGYDPSAGSADGKHYQWSYHIGDVSGNAIYTITYTSIIENYSEYLKRNNETRAWNEVWFDFRYPMGDGLPQKEFHGPTAGAEVEEIYPNIIEKTGVYDPATHRLTWTIAVNPNRIDLPNAVVTDWIPDGQRLVSTAVAIADDVTVTTTENKEDNSVTFYFGIDGLSGRTATITLVTELGDSESHKWANNWSGVLENKVTLNADGLAENGVSDTGSASAKSVVIDKDMGDFNYADHTIPVTIIINQNNMKLTGITVTDQLSDYGLALVKERGVQMDDIFLKEGTEENRPSYRYDGGTLQIYPESLIGKAKITFWVQVTDQYMNANRAEPTIYFVNTATLISDQNANEVSVRDTIKMTNRPIVKTGTLNRRAAAITYTVEFNRTLADLPAGLVLTDTLPDGLLFKQPTIKLWIADVNSITGAMRKTDREATGYTVRIFASGVNTVMQISLPSGKQAYILEYDVQIVDKEKAPFVNRVDVSSYPGDRIGEGSISFSKVQVAGARLEDLIYVKVRKVDTFGRALPGAVFALVQGEEQLMLGSTGEDGCITFAGVAENTEYTIVELQAPEGYVTSSTEWTFITGTKGGEAYALEEIFVNQESADPDASGGDNGEPSTPDDGGETTEPDDSGEVPDSGNQDEVSKPGDKGGISDPEDGGEVSTPGDQGEASKPKDSGEASEPKGSDSAMEPTTAEQTQEPLEESLETDTQMELDRLPKTGGFWGSGIMYIIGAMGILLMAGTFFLNMCAKWRTAREISAFETGLLLTKPEHLPNQEEEDSVSLPEEGEQPKTAQELQDENGVLAVLSIPSISCKAAVKEGSNRGILAKALGHMEGTALPGQIGNCVIAGHRNYNFGLYFNRLNEVALGDEIAITTREGVYTYTVTEIKVVEPEELSVLDQTENARLTLITCTPIYIATHRLIVVAELNYQ